MNTISLIAGVCCISGAYSSEGVYFKGFLLVLGILNLVIYDLKSQQRG